MNFKKIFWTICIIMLLICMTGGRVFALTDCNVDMKLNKSEFINNEEIIVEVNLSNVNSKEGVIAFGATLEYDKNSLEFINMEGQNGWQTPTYNEKNGKLVSDRNKPTKDNETMFKIKFKVKTENKSNVKIALKNISLADGELPMKEISELTKSISIKGKNIEPKPNENTNTNTNTNTNKITNTEISKNKNDVADGTESKGKLPKTGVNVSSYIIIAMCSVSALAIVFYIKYRKINK